MSDIGGIFTPFDLFAMALIAGAPGFLVGAFAGAFLWRDRRLAGLTVGAVVGFALCLAAVYLWITELK